MIEKPALTRGQNSTDGLCNSNNAVTEHKDIGHYCQELGFQGVSHCDWTDCSYANICKAVKA